MLYAAWLCVLGEGRTAGAPAMVAMRRFKLTILKLRLIHIKNIRTDQEFHKKIARY